MITVDKLARIARALPPARFALRVAVRLLAPRNLVGVVGVIWNDSGSILLVRHLVRIRFEWGLPGGWVERGEDPAVALRREIREELALDVDDLQLLLCQGSGGEDSTLSPRSIAIAFSCRTDGQPRISRELLEFKWIDPLQIDEVILPFHRDAIGAAVALR
jgi:8-oxo-dGTP diphosphatase